MELPDLFYEKLIAFINSDDDSVKEFTDLICFCQLIFDDEFSFPEICKVYQYAEMYFVELMDKKPDHVERLSEIYEKIYIKLFNMTRALLDEADDNFARWSIWNLLPSDIPTKKEFELNNLVIESVRNNSPSEEDLLLIEAHQLKPVNV
jgi:hypothetical protein